VAAKDAVVDRGFVRYVVAQSTETSASAVTGMILFNAKASGLEGSTEKGCRPLKRGELRTVVREYENFFNEDATVPDVFKCILCSRDDISRLEKMLKGDSMLTL
jgi:hypothetical protein